MKNSKIAKQILGIFLSLALLISCLPMGLIATADTTEMTPLEQVNYYGDFEEAFPDGFSLIKGASAAEGSGISNEYALDGDYSYKLITNNWGGIYTQLNLEANTTYIFRVAVMAINSKPAGAPNIYVNDRVDWVTDYVKVNKSYANVGVWKYVTETFTTNKAGQYRVGFGGVNSGHTLYFDNFALAKATDLTDGYNLVKNGSFEYGLVEFPGSNVNYHSIVRDAHTGLRSAHFSGSGKYYGFNQVISVEANTEYVLSFWGKKASGSTGNGTAFKIQDGTGTNLVSGTGDPWLLVNGNANDMTKWGKTFNTFNTGSLTSIKLSIYHLVAESWVDDVRIGKKTTLTATAEYGGTAKAEYDYYAQGDTAKVTAKPNANFTFDGWYNANGEKVSSDVTYTFQIIENTVLTARFAFNATINEAVISDQSFEEDFDLEGWSHFKADYPAGIVTDALAANGDYSLYVTEPTDTVARHSFMRQTVEVEPNTDYLFSFNGLRVNSGSAPQVKIEGTDLSVQKWVNGTGSFTRNEIAFNSGSNTAVKIVFAVDGGAAYVDDLHIGKKVNFSVTAGEGGSVTKSFNALGYGDNVTVWAIENTGYKFDGWYSGDDKVADTTAYKFTANGDVNLQARFVNDVIKEPVLSNPDFEDLDTGLSAWTDKNSLGQITDEYAVSGDYALKISCDPSDSGSWCGISQSFTVTPNTDYILTFNGKRVDGKKAPQVKVMAGGTQIIQYYVNNGYNTYAFNSGNNTTLKIEFTVNAKDAYAAYVDDINVGKKVNFAVTAGEGGTTTQSTQYIGYGADATVWALADEGYKFEGWYAGDDKVADTTAYTFTADGDVALEARFTKLAAGDFDGDGAVTSGEIATLRQKLLGVNSLSDILADVNGDGNVNILDLINIKKRAAGLI